MLRKSLCFSILFIHMYNIHVYARIRTREGVNTGGLKFTNIKTFKCDGGLVDSSALYSNDESSNISEGTNCYATEPSC